MSKSKRKVKVKLVEITARELIVIVVFITLSLSYCLLVLKGFRDESNRLGELLTVVTIAIVSYYLGYTQRQRRGCSRGLVSFEDVKKTAKRLGYIACGFGIGLILQHLVLYGIDLKITELLLGHEWIGLYCLIIGMILVGWGLGKK